MHNELDNTVLVIGNFYEMEGNMAEFRTRRMIEPDTEKCRALPIGAKYSRCLTEVPQCKHAIQLRDNCYCSHPDHHSFEIKTASPLVHSSPQLS